MVDVLVVGGGPAGLAAAIAARRKGLSVMVADGARPPIDKACGEGLMPDGLAALSQLGVIIGQSDSYPFRGIRFLESGIAVDASFPSGHGLGLRRTILHARLIEAAEQAGVRLCWGNPVRSVEADGVCIGAHIGDRLVRSRWIIGADGGNSRVRRWSGLDDCVHEDRRFAFRRHYSVAPWTDCMEIYWAKRYQIYVTPVGPEEVCVALISRDPHLRLDKALQGNSEIARRLCGVAATTTERGAVSASRKLKRVYRDRIALIGDASGSVDAITGEGLCLAFRQALALADALEAGDLAGYQAEHIRLMKRPAFMARLMLMLENRAWLRRRAVTALSSSPGIFEKMLAMHAGTLTPTGFAWSSLALGWRMLTV
jgi:flavin-dependent dehydrogenase